MDETQRVRNLYPLGEATDLKLGDAHDIFHLNLFARKQWDAIDYAEYCRYQVNQLVIVENYPLRQRVYRQLLQSLTEMRDSLTAPLSARHRTKLNTDSQATAQALLAVDSQTLLEYCLTLTQTLIAGMMSCEAEEILGGLLFDLIYLQADELQYGIA